MKHILSILIIGVMMCTYNASNANSPISSDNLSELNQDDVWSFIKQDFGVNVHFKEITVGKNNYLTTLFKNTSNQEVSFSFVIKDKDGKIVATASKLSVAAQGDFETTDVSMMVLLNGGSKINDYTIELKQ